MKVLLVDDSSTMRRIQRNVLEGIGLKEIEEAVDGQDALTKLSFNPELILLDWNMPNMDGSAFLKQIRTMDQYKNTKIIMVTSESEKSKIIEAIKNGANSYIIKPFTPEVLKEKLKDLKLME